MTLSTFRGLTAVLSTLLVLTPINAQQIKPNPDENLAK
jgi:hypothetical protein